MLRPRKEPDPLHGKRKLLDEQERLLAERMSQLNDQLARGCAEEGVKPKSNEPPVWRLEDDAPPAPLEQPTVNKRVLARQRQRDMIFFFVMMGALLVVVLLVWALAHSHGPGALSGS